MKRGGSAISNNDVKRMRPLPSMSVKRNLSFDNNNRVKRMRLLPSMKRGLTVNTDNTGNSMKRRKVNDPMNVNNITLYMSFLKRPGSNNRPNRGKRVKH